MTEKEFLKAMLMTFPGLIDGETDCDPDELRTWIIDRFALNEVPHPLDVRAVETGRDNVPSQDYKGDPITLQVIRCPACKEEDCVLYCEDVEETRTVLGMHGGRLYIGPDIQHPADCSENERFWCKECGYEWILPEGQELEFT